MINEKIFREYDLRGKYPEDINEETAYIFGKSYATYIKIKYNQTKCIVSRDNRLSSKSLSDNLIKGLMESGCSVIDYGETTTPMNFFARNQTKLFGIMITASHNPKDDNGIKFSFGGKSNAYGKDIEDFKIFTLSNNFNNDDDTTYERDDIKDEYIKYMVDNIKLGRKKIKVVVDPGNGATTVIAKKIFDQFNIDTVIINGENDGSFPNHHPDPAEPQNLTQLKEAVFNHNADLGIAYDGDGDRIGFVKNNGEILSVEEFMILIIREMNPKVNNKTYLYDVKCSKALEEEITKLGGTPFMYRTGASYTQSKTHEDNLPFGGEFSGHVYFRDRCEDLGSAIYASLRLVEVLSKNDQTIAQLTSNIAKYHLTEEIKIPTSDDYKFKVVERIKQECINNHYNIVDIDGVKVYFENGWALIRASNTGPNLIFRVEADTNEDKEKLYKYFSNMITKMNVKNLD